MKLKSSLLVALLLAMMSLTFPKLALAMEEDGCVHDDPTIQTLRDCVLHAAAVGHIDNAGVTQSLLAELDAAQAALDRGQTDVAIDLLQSFIATVQAQAGKHIVAEHAAHLVEHAQKVITALSQ